MHTSWNPEPFSNGEYHVPTPYHSKGREYWYVADAEGEPIDSFETEAEALALAVALNNQERK